MTSSAGSHEAASSALGYLYQSQWPLVELLRRSAGEPDAAITIELYDDVAWEQDGTPKELLQLKHHVDKAKTLGDKDDDLWRTIRSWMDAHPPGDADGPLLSLVTTSTAADGTAAASLRPGDTRKPDKGRERLEVAAKESTAKATEDVRQRFLDLPSPERAVFVSRIYVLDGAPAIGEELDAELRRALYFVIPAEHEGTFVDLLWAWWHRVVVELLRKDRGNVTALELKAKVDELRDTFARENLPTLVRPEDVDENIEAAYSTRPFVQQLRWIALTSVLLQKAMIDYYRAYKQSQLWLEDNLIALDEMTDFEARLKDEWERQFEFMKLKLPADADDQAQQEAGQQLFQLVTQNSTVRVRAYEEPFFTRGKFHALADDGHVGWHPDFQARLSSLLLGDGLA